MFALAEGTVGDALQQARVVFEGADHGAPELMAPDALRDLKASRVRGHQSQPADLSDQTKARREHSVEATAWTFRNIWP